MHCTDYKRLDDEGRKFYITALSAISRRMPVWPPVDESVQFGHKATIIEMLDRAARIVTKTRRPISEILTDRHTLPLSTTENPQVLKREYSEGGGHVQLPVKVQKTTPRFLEKLLQDPERWVLQQYVPYLQRFGELRVFIAGGRIVQTVCTVKRNKDGIWALNFVSGHHSLAEMWYVTQNLPFQFSALIFYIKLGTS